MVCIGLQKCHSGDLNWTNINMYPPAHSLLYVFCEKWETLPEKNQESLFTVSYSAISDTLSASCWLPLTLRNTTINSSNARFPSSILLTLSFQLKSNSILSFKNTHLLTEQFFQIVIQQRVDEKVLQFLEAYLARKSQSAYIHGTVLPKARLFWVLHLPTFALIYEYFLVKLTKPPQSESISQNILPRCLFYHLIHGLICPYWCRERCIMSLRQKALCCYYLFLETARLAIMGDELAIGW